MSYMALAALGQDQGPFAPEPETWARISAEDDEIYLWHAQVIGIGTDRTADLKEMSRAFGQVMASQTIGGFDVKAVIVSPYACDTAPGCSFVTIIITLSAAGATGMGMTLLDTASVMGEQWRERLLSRYPQLEIISATWLQYADSDQNRLIIDHWRTRSTVWDVSLGELGGATQAWGLGLGCLRARTSEGIFGAYSSNDLEPYPTSVPGLVPPPDLLPEDERSDIMVWLAVAAVAGYGIYTMARRYS